MTHQWTIPPRSLSSISLRNTTVLIILNSPISSRQIFRYLWRSSRFHICADGGANRLYDLNRSFQSSFSQNENYPFSLKNRPEPGRDVYIPDVIHGDLDSILDHVLSHYTSLDVEIVEDGDQYSTDLEKCVNLVLSRNQDVCAEMRVGGVYILGSLGGRVDHAIGLLSTLLKLRRLSAESKEGGNFFLFTDQNISFILWPGLNVIVFSKVDTDGNKKDGIEVGDKVGILPIYGEACISTKGLTWDVDDWKTEMGGQISTSNYLPAGQDTVEVKTDREVVFTISLKVNGCEL